MEELVDLIAVDSSATEVSDKIKDILYKVSEHGLLELTEDAIEEFVEVSNNGMINVNVLAEQTKTDVLQKVLNYIVREASKYATSYIQAEHSVISLNEKDFSTGLTDEEREKLNASLSLLEDIGKSSSLWPPTLASRSDEKPTVGDIFEY
jgi:histone H3/H4